MKNLPENIIEFFDNQHFTVVSTINSNGHIHNACKGIVRIARNRRVYLLDLYKGVTYENLKKNHNISITAVDEHSFKGYCLQGIARIEKPNKMIKNAWEKKMTSRITKRVLKNLSGQKGHPKHPEALLPKPEYMIVVDVKAIVDLTPQHMKG